MSSGVFTNCVAQAIKGGQIVYLFPSDQDTEPITTSRPDGSPLVLKIRDIELENIFFSGVNKLDQDDLKQLLHSSEGETFDLRLVKLDKIILANYYRENGFLIVEILDSLVINKDEKEVEAIPFSDMLSFYQQLGIPIPSQ